MKFKRITTIFVDFNYITALIPTDVFYGDEVTIGGKTYECIEDFLDKCPNARQDDCLKLVIELKTGHVINWPKNHNIDLHTIKVVDSGTYKLSHHPDIVEDTDIIYEGYVPTCFGDEYGDYLEFEIDDNSYIPGWKFTQKHFDNIIKEANS